MRILLISPLCPLPLEKGGAVRVWNIAKQLAANHTVDLLCFIRKDEEQERQAELEQVFRNVHFVKRREIFSPRELIGGKGRVFRFIRRNWKLICDTVFSVRSLLFELCNNAEIKRYVYLADAEREYDLIYVETYYAGAAILDDICAYVTPVLVCEQNVEYAAYRRQLGMQQNVLVKLVMWWDVWKMRYEERLFWKRAPMLSALSVVDRREMEDATGRTDVKLLENGVDVAWFSEKLVERRTNEILFVGNFSYFPNVDAVRWLVEEIWPLVRKNGGTVGNSVTLRIVGRGADSGLKEFVKAKGLEIDESVHDIRAAFQRATMLIAPLRSGSGTKYKILEGLASGCPLITTSIGAEGLKVKHGAEMLIADDSKGLASLVVQVLNDSETARKLSKAGLAYVQKKYNWTELVHQFEAQLFKVHD